MFKDENPAALMLYLAQLRGELQHHQSFTPKLGASFLRHPVLTKVLKPAEQRAGRAYH
jgi:hypothetical protein